MKIFISSDAKTDLINGYWFYENQQTGLGDYFRTSVTADIESLQIYGGIHARETGFQRKLCKSYPFTIYYMMNNPNSLTVVADQRQNPRSIRDRLGKKRE